MKKTIRFLLVLFILLLKTFSAFADTTSTTPEPYAENEFPAWAKDARRTEIITFGSLPFTTLGTILGYGGYLYYKGEIDSFPNPLDKSESYFDSTQIKHIVAISMGASCALGMTDLTINLIRRHMAHKKEQKKLYGTQRVIVEPLKPEDVGNLLNQNDDEDEDDLNINEVTDATSITDVTDVTEDFVNVSDIDSDNENDTSDIKEDVKE